MTRAHFNFLATFKGTLSTLSALIQTKSKQASDLKVQASQAYNLFFFSKIKNITNNVKIDFEKRGRNILG